MQDCVNPLRRPLFTPCLRLWAIGRAMNAQTSIAAEVDRRPASAVSGAVGLAGLCGLAGWTAVSRILGFEGPSAALCALLACALPMIAWSLAVAKVQRSASSGTDWGRPPRRRQEPPDLSLPQNAPLGAHNRKAS